MVRCKKYSSGWCMVAVQKGSEAISVDSGSMDSLDDKHQDQSVATSNISLDHAGWLMLSIDINVKKLSRFQDKTYENIVG